MAEGGNEILAARALPGTLALDGLLATGDAMPAWTGTARLARDKGGDDPFALRATAL